MSQENERRARELAHELWQKWIDYENDNALKWDELGVPALVQALDEAEARGRPQWRPASERPPRRGWYLTVPSEDNEHAPPTPSCTERLWNGERWMGLAPVEVTHWMPLPEPPTPTTEKD